MSKRGTYEDLAVRSQPGFRELPRARRKALYRQEAAFAANNKETKRRLALMDFSEVKFSPVDYE